MSDKCVPEEVLQDFFTYIKFMGYPNDKMTLLEVKKSVAPYCEDAVLIKILKPVESWRKDKEGCQQLLNYYTTLHKFKNSLNKMNFYIHKCNLKKKMNILKGIL